MARTAKKKSSSRSRSKKKSKSKRRGKKGTSFLQSIRERISGWFEQLPFAHVFRHGRLIGWSLLIITVTVAWWLGVPGLRSTVAETTIASASEDVIEVSFVDAPTWFDGDLRNVLTATARDLLTADPFARHELMEVRLALLESGCFASIEQVTRIDATHVEVAASFLVPHAVVVHGGTERMIDRHGRVLPEAYRPGDVAHFVRIVGVRYDPPQRLGERWDGGDLDAALRVLESMESKPWIRQVTSIDVAEYLNDQPLNLITDRGTTLIWGSPTGKEHGGEVSADEKIKRLDHMYQSGRIDNFHDGALDLTNPRWIFSESTGG